MKNMVNKKIFSIDRMIIGLILLVLSFLCIIPIVAILSISLSNEIDIVRRGYSLLPREVDLMAYRFIFKNPAQIIRAYAVTIFVTGFGTLSSLLVMSLIAYPLSRQDFAYRNKLSFFVFFTLIFNGGLVPLYMVVTQVLHIQDTLWAMILPILASPWNILLLRTFFKQLPLSIIESAKIDGSSEIRTFFVIALPLTKAGLATIGTFVSLMYWNDWWMPLLFIHNNKLSNLQYMLYRIMSSISALTQNIENLPMGVDIKNLPNESARMAMCVLAMGPMLFVFPFFQKHFIRGITIGSIKG
jgi:putative aldouronate transport system permease protein